MSTQNAIRSFREGRGLTQDEFAKALGTTQSVISRLECDERFPSRSLALRLQKVSGGKLSLDTLLSGKFMSEAGQARLAVARPGNGQVVSTATPPAKTATGSRRAPSRNAARSSRNTVGTTGKEARR